MGTGSREENASKNSLEPPLRFNRNGKGSSRTPVIQTLKIGALITRHELADHDWVAIKPMLPNVSQRPYRLPPSPMIV
jgi:hypothetical protein